MTNTPQSERNAIKVEKAARRNSRAPKLRAPVFLVLMIGSTFGALADSITFSEKWTESVITTNDGTGTTYEQVAKDNGSGKAVLTVPGLQSLSSDDFAGTAVNLSLGNNIVLADNLGNADSFTSTKAVFNLTISDDSGNEVKVAQISFSRSNNTLTISFQTTSWEMAIAADNYLDLDGPISDTVPFHLDFGDFSAERNLYVTGNDVVTQKTLGTGDDQQQFSLNAVTISAAADFTPPTLTVLYPPKGARLTNELVTVQVKATDNNQVSDVQFALNGGDFQSADSQDGNVWSIDLDSTAGTNVVQVIALDAEGNVSKTNSLSYVYTVMSQVSLKIIGNGTVSGVTDGQALEVGKTYTATAAPAAGWIFAGWGGDVAGATLKFSFRMQDGLSLAANFVPNPFPPVAGTYTGLFYDRNGVTPTNAGYLSIKVTSQGAYTGTLKFGLASSTSLSGQFYLASDYVSGNDTANVHSVVTVNKTNFLDLSLQLDGLTNSAGASLGGQVNLFADRAETQSIWANWADVWVERSSYSNSPPPGVYNFVLPPAASDPTQGPGGYSYGSATLAKGGTVTLALHLADGTSPVITFSSAVAQDGSFPIFASLYGGQGVLLGWLQFTNDTALFNAAKVDLESLDSALYWVAATQKYYPKGFMSDPSTFIAFGSRYVSPKAGTNLFGSTSATFDADAGQTDEAAAALSFTPSSNTFAVQGANTNKVSIKFATTSGAFSGQFGQKAKSFNGIVLPTLQAGFGYYVGPSNTGPVSVIGSNSPLRQ